MCDYSLESVKSTKAQQGASYTLTTLGYGGSKGFTSAEDCGTAACVPEGTMLRIEVPEAMQYDHGVTALEDVVTTRVDIDNRYTYHDAVTFESGRTEKLQSFPVGTAGTVLVLGDMPGREDATLATASAAYAYID